MFPLLNINVNDETMGIKKDVEKTITLYLTKEETELVEKIKEIVGEKTASKVFKKLLLYPERYDNVVREKNILNQRMITDKNNLNEEIRNLKLNSQNMIDTLNQEYSDYKKNKEQEIQVLKDRINNFATSFKDLFIDNE